MSEGDTIHFSEISSTSLAVLVVEIRHQLSWTGREIDFKDNALAACFHWLFHSLTCDLDFRMLGNTSSVFDLRFIGGLDRFTPRTTPTFVR